MRYATLATLLILSLALAGCKSLSSSPSLSPGPELDHVQTAQALFQAALDFKSDSPEAVEAEAARLAELFFHTPPETADMMLRGLTKMMLDFNKLRDNQADWRLDSVSEIEALGDTAKAMASLRYTMGNADGQAGDGVRYLTVTLVRVDKVWRVALIS